MAMIRMAAIALCIAGCTKAEPPKPEIPSDLQLVCYEGKLGAHSEAAAELFLFSLPCKAPTSI